MSTNECLGQWPTAITRAEPNQGIRLDDVRLLLVDDSLDNQRLFSRILSAAGAKVRTAANGLLAIESFLEDPDLHVIIMDIRMPLMDGYEATRRLRSHGFRPPIIALTAHANPGEEERCRDAGCSHFVLKPIDRQTLLKTVRCAIDEGEGQNRL